MHKRLLLPILILFILPVAILVLLTDGMTAGTPLSVMTEMGVILLLPAIFSSTDGSLAICEEPSSSEQFASSW